MRLKEWLVGVVPEERLARLSSRFHVIGDIAILYLDPELDGYKDEIASALLDQCRNVRTVFNKITPLEGERRTSRLSFWQAREIPSPFIGSSAFDIIWMWRGSFSTAVWVTRG